VSGKPPGLLRRLARVAGSWLYAVLITFGWQPREDRDTTRNR
jgi:hypothetical protein